MKRIQSRTGEHSKPKALEATWRNPLSVHFACTTLLSTLLLMMLVLALFCTTVLPVMQLRAHTAALGHNPFSTAPEPCLTPPPFCTERVLAWAPANALRKLYPAADVQRTAAPLATISTSFLEVHARNGEKEISDKSFRWLRTWLRTWSTDGLTPSSLLLLKPWS
ncbi:hypothetical protein COO60DRAFT_1589415 [Scenedesmus sp. NREL 46B-D3]|nr:hypothetical protein COO60DRAFT_1589415 [Scenedesmus sp. NREL 46B-D3]